MERCYWTFVEALDHVMAMPALKALRLCTRARTGRFEASCLMGHIDLIAKIRFQDQDRQFKMRELIWSIKPRRST